jgi:hypothetical protein
MLTCVQWFEWLATGIVIVPLLAWLKTLPNVGTFIEKYAGFFAPFLAFLLPQIAKWLSPYCAVIDPLAWAAILTAATYLVSQILYYTAKWIGEKTGVKVLRNL